MATSNVAIWQGAVDGIIDMINEFGQSMRLQTRSITTPNFGSVDFSEKFEKKATFIGAIDTAETGRTIFNGTGVEEAISHIIYTEFMEKVDSEDWILYDGRRFDIIEVEDIGELNAVLKFECSERGTIENKANEA